MKKIRTTIIGLGNITHRYEDNPKISKRIKYPTHLSAIKKDKRFILVGACDLDKKARKSFLKKVSKSVGLYSDYKEMIKEQHPDLVVVCTPTETHIKICKYIIKSGVKNILCEKPIGYSLRDAKSLVKLAKRNRIKIGFNYFRVFDLRYQKLIKLIKNNDFGKIKSLNAKYSKGIYNTASHIINLFEKMLGPVKKVKVTSKISNEKDPNIDFLAEFSKVSAEFKSYKSKKLILEIEMEFNNKNIKISKDRSKDFKLNIGASMLDVYDNLYKFIFNKEKISCSAKDALQTLSVVDKVVNSI